MKTRILSGIIGLPIIIFIVFIGGLALKMSLIALSLIGLFEYFVATSSAKNPVNILVFILTPIYYLSISYVALTDLTPTIISAVVVSFLMTTVIFYEKVTLTDVSNAIFGFLYIPFLMSTLYFLRESDDGYFFVWLVFIGAWGSDTFAYFTGKAIGKHRLAPKLSPNKTIEGAFGGVFGAVLLGIIYAVSMTRINGLSSEGNSYLVVSIVSSAAAVLSQFGDLAASAIKRHKNIKDFGNLIPGHGGVLDRFDSLLFTSAGIWVFLTIAEKIALRS